MKILIFAVPVDSKIIWILKKVGTPEVFEGYGTRQGASGAYFY